MRAPDIKTMITEELDGVHKEGGKVDPDASGWSAVLLSVQCQVLCPRVEEFTIEIVHKGDKIYSIIGGGSYSDDFKDDSGSDDRLRYLERVNSKLTEALSLPLIGHAHRDLFDLSYAARL